MLTESEVEAEYGRPLNKRRLQQWRYLRRGGPAYLKIGDRVYYERNEIENFLNGNVVVPTPSDNRRVS
jgi:hypothetical protein